MKILLALTMTAVCSLSARAAGEFADAVFSSLQIPEKIELTKCLTVQHGHASFSIDRHDRVNIVCVPTEEVVQKGVYSPPAPLFILTDGQLKGRAIPFTVWHYMIHAAENPNAPPADLHLESDRLHERVGMMVVSENASRGAERIKKFETYEHREFVP
jgi:hypothetical protein